MQNLTKKIPLAIATALAFACAPGTAPALAANTSVNVNVSVDQQSGGEIDWTKGAESDVVATGIGLPGNKGWAMARVAAVMDAQRNLVGIIEGVDIDSDTTMQDLEIQSDVVKRKIKGLLKGAQVIGEGANPDGSYWVQMRVPLYGATGSLASVVLPEIMDMAAEPMPFPDAMDMASLPPEDMQSIQEAGYTGIVIDASGMGLEPTFSPVIYDTEGRAIYGIENLQFDAIISRGMVGYAKSLTDSAVHERAGANPLVVHAESIRGGNGTSKVNTVVSVEDANRILLANDQSGMLKKCAVVFVR